MANWIKREKGWLREHVRNKPISPIESPKESSDDQQSKNLPGYGIIYHPIKCPRCKSKNIKTYASRPPIRYHKCKKCKFLFRSIEEDGVELLKKEQKSDLKVVTTL